MNEEAICRHCNNSRLTRDIIEGICVPCRLEKNDSHAEPYNVISGAAIFEPIHQVVRKLKRKVL